MNKSKLVISLTVSCFAFISIQERANKHKLFSIYNTKSTLKNVFYFKSKLNQVSVIALPDW